MRIQNQNIMSDHNIFSLSCAYPHLLFCYAWHTTLSAYVAVHDSNACSNLGSKRQCASFGSYCIDDFHVRPEIRYPGYYRMCSVLRDVDFLFRYLHECGLT